MLTALLWPLGATMLVMPAQQHVPGIMRPRPTASRAQPIFPLQHAAHVFPSESMATMTPTLLADVEQRTPEEDIEAKGRGRIILGVIVANSIFWQYVLPIFKGQPTSTGRKKK